MKKILLNIALLALVLFMASCSGSITEGDSPEDAIDAFLKAIDAIDSYEDAEEFRSKTLDFNGEPLAYMWEGNQRTIDFLKKNGGYDRVEIYPYSNRPDDKGVCDSICRYHVVVFAKNAKYGSGYVEVRKKGDRYIACPFIAKSEAFDVLDQQGYRNVLSMYDYYCIENGLAKPDQYKRGLFGKFSTFQDPVVELEVYKYPAPEENFNNAMVYGSIVVTNEYFEREYIMYITAIKPDGSNLVADVTVTQMQGDPEEGDVSYAVKGKETVKIKYVEEYIVQVEGCKEFPSQKFIQKDFFGNPKIAL